MKKNLLTFICIATTSIGVAQRITVPNGNVGTVLNGSENIGIHTSYPNEKLHIKSTATNETSTILLEGTDNIENSAGLRIREGSVNRGAYLKYNSKDNYMSLGVTNIPSNQSVDTDAFQISRSTGNTYFKTATLFHEKVGINTNNPDSELTVNGLIHATEVRIDMDVLPDYVFEENYHLRTLNEVENYIDENGHLPEIPSAKQVADNGMNMGQMQAKLLEKIEELTLYTIAQEKRIAELNKQNEQLKVLSDQMTQMQEELKQLKQH